MADLVLRHQLLKAISSDPAFLKTGVHYVDPEMFLEEEERVVARLALDFWIKNQEPIGMLLSGDAEEQAQKLKFSTEKKSRLKDLLTTLQNGKMQLVSVKALLERAERLRRKTFYTRAMDTIVGAYEDGSLTSQSFEEILIRANKELHVNGFDTRNLFEEVEQRNVRRAKVDTKKYPWCGIKPLDDEIKLIARGQFAFLLAPPASGKGLALVQIGMALVMQHYKVLHFTLEDPVDLVEDRMDAAFAGLPMSRLAGYPRTLRERFAKLKSQYRGRIKIIDGTDGGWTISKIEKVWEQERQAGFTADAIIIDYDDEIEAEKTYKGDRVRLLEFTEIYRSIRRLASKLNIIVWTAAQATRAAEKKEIITGADVAEDYGKIRKAFLAISISKDKAAANQHTLYVMRHRLDRSKFAVKIKTDFSKGLFYDAEGTRKMMIEEMKKRKEKR